MRLSALSVPLLIALAVPAHPQSTSGMPMISSVEPNAGKAGDLLTVQGSNLDRSSVAALFLTDGTNDIKVSIIEQNTTTITFKIPAEAKPGRFALMVLTPGKSPKLIEEPVKITVELATTG